MAGVRAGPEGVPSLHGGRSEGDPSRKCRGTCNLARGGQRQAGLLLSDDVRGQQWRRHDGVGEYGELCEKRKI